MGWPVFGLPPLKKFFGGVIAIISFRPGGWMHQSAVPRCAILSVGSTGGIGVSRREFARRRPATWPLAARAQQAKVARIGALYIGLADAESFKKELREGLRELGYVEGQNIAFEFRSAEGKLDRLHELAAELVRAKVDAIVALHVPSALAAKQATRSPL